MTIPYSIDRIDDERLPLEVREAIWNLRNAIFLNTDWLGAQVTIDNLREPDIKWTLDVKIRKEE